MIHYFLAIFPYSKSLLYLKSLCLLYPFLCRRIPLGLMELIIFFSLSVSTSQSSAKKNLTNALASLLVNGNFLVFLQAFYTLSFDIHKNIIRSFSDYKLHFISSFLNIKNITIVFFTFKLYRCYTIKIFSQLSIN